MMPMPMQLLVVMLGLVYTCQAVLAIIRLYEQDTMFQTFKNYKSRGAFWFLLLVPILPLIWSIYLKSKEIPK